MFVCDFWHSCMLCQDNSGTLKLEPGPCSMPHTSSSMEGMPSLPHHPTVQIPVLAGQRVQTTKHWLKHLWDLLWARKLERRRRLGLQCLPPNMKHVSPTTAPLLPYRTYYSFPAPSGTGSLSQNYLLVNTADIVGLPAGFGGTRFSPQVQGFLSTTPSTILPTLHSCYFPKRK